MAPAGSRRSTSRTTARDLALDARNLGFPVSDLGVLTGRVTELWSGQQVPAQRVAEQSDAARGVAPGSVALRLRVAPHGAALLRFDSSGAP